MSYPIKAKISEIIKHYITCPYEDCKAEGEEGPGSITHLLDCDTSFGPWYCKKCHRGIFGDIMKGEIFLHFPNERQKEMGMDSSKPSLVLLRLDPLPQSLFLVVKGIMHGDKIDHENNAYYYNEHTCPTNYLQDAEVVIIGKDNDPHGLFEYVKSVPHPGEDVEVHNMDIEELAKLFNIDGAIITGAKELPNNETKFICSPTKEA